MTMAIEVAVAGVGIHPFGRHEGISLMSMAHKALFDALSAAEKPLDSVGAMFIGNALGGTGVVARLAEDLGIRRIPVTRVEQACASGSTAFRLACEAVASGSCETAVALGVEKMGSGLLQFEIEPTYESRLGLDLFPLLYALKTRQCLAENVTLEDLASIAVKAHRSGAAAPHAIVTRQLSMEDAASSPAVVDPISRVQCCRNADGAAAAVVTAVRPGDRRVRVVGWVGGIATEDPTTPMSGGWDSRELIVQEMARALYEQSGMGPADMDVLQVNDAFAVAEPLYLEALGFAERGEGVFLHRSGATAANGRLPTNTDGGLLGRGHALGATGLAMVYEIVTQLCGNASDRQVANPRTGLIQSHGFGGENLFILAN
jgi:acetyl-CoA acetyltransferase